MYNLVQTKTYINMHNIYASANNVYSLINLSTNLCKNKKYCAD